MRAATATPVIRNGLDPPLALEQSSDLLAAAQTQRLRYQELFDFTTDGYLVTDRFGVILEANPAVAAVLGTPRAFLPGKPLGFYFEEGQRQAFYNRLSRPKERVERWQSAVRPPRGELRLIEVIQAADDQGFRFILRDVTAIRQAERLAAIGQITADLAHEGRNALQRIQTCLSILQVLLEGQLEPLELIGRAQRAQDDLTQLFEEVRAYGAPLRLEIGPTDLAETWRQVWAELGPAAAGARLREEIGEVNLNCMASPFHLRQVFRNLLDNALAACRGQAEIVIRCAPDQLNGAAAIRVWVSDNGPGIPPEVRKHLFEPFHTTKVRGTGLGLAICKRLIEAHGGRIELGESTAQGTEISIILPRSRGAK